MSSSPPTAPPSRPALRGGGILARGWVVRSVIAITLLLTLGMVSLIYIRWVTVQEPTATIIIAGDSSLDGAQVVLSGGPSGLVPATLDQENDFTTPVHLQPGQYHLTVKMADSLSPILDTDVSVDRLRTNVFTLPTLLTLVGEAVDDEADVSLTGGDGLTNRQELDQQNSFSASWRLSPGKYHLTVVRQGITLYDNPTLTINANQPRSIDLNQPQHGHE
jgi:hypothetical protein